MAAPLPDPFSTALDAVIEAIQARREAGGGGWSAPRGALEALRAAVAVGGAGGAETKKTLALKGRNAPGAVSLGAGEGNSLSAPRGAGALGREGGDPVFRNAPGEGAEPEAVLVSDGGAGGWGGALDKAARMARLRSGVLACTQCARLAQTRTQVVFGVGNLDAELMLVGEAPGAEEDRIGEPFVGPAGELLDKMLVAMGLSRQEVFIANVLKCRPDMPPGAPGNRKPEADEMSRCLPYLREQIAIVQPRVMVALGATAMQGLFGRSEPMARLRSRWYDFASIPVMATYHPSYLLHNQALTERRKVWEDLLQVLEKLGRPITPKQAGFFAPKGQA